MRGGQYGWSIGSRTMAGQARSRCVQDRAVQTVEECWGFILELDLCFRKMSPVPKGN